MPTSLELAGIAKPKHVEFHSLMPLLSGERKKSYLDSVYGAYFGVQRAMIHDGYKLILYPAAKVARLYNLKADPMEMHDLARDPKSMPQLFKNNGYTTVLIGKKSNCQTTDTPCPLGIFVHPKN